VTTQAQVAQVPRLLRHGNRVPLQVWHIAAPRRPKLHRAPLLAPRQPPFDPRRRSPVHRRNVAPSQLRRIPARHRRRRRGCAVAHPRPVPVLFCLPRSSLLHCLPRQHNHAWPVPNNLLSNMDQGENHHFVVVPLSPTRTVWFATVLTSSIDPTLPAHSSVQNHFASFPAPISSHPTPRRSRRRRVRLSAPEHNCTYKSKQKGSIKQHRVDVHGIGVTWHACAEVGCEYKSKREGTIKQHRVDVHGIGVTWHDCPELGCECKRNRRATSYMGPTSTTSAFSGSSALTAATSTSTSRASTRPSNRRSVVLATRTKSAFQRCA